MKKNESEKEQELILKHLGLALTHSKKFKTTTVVDKDDYLQIALMALLKAIRKHNPSKAQLQTFAWPIIINSLITEYNKAVNKNLQNISKEPSYESDMSIFDLLPKLNEQEEKIIQYRIEGYNNREIASFLDISQETIRDTLTRVYMKIKDKNE